jgi:hypothetical protein
MVLQVIDGETLRTGGGACTDHLILAEHAGLSWKSAPHPRPSNYWPARHEPGKGSRGARRILQRHLIDVIYRAMITDQATWQHQIIRHELAA